MHQDSGLGPLKFCSDVVCCSSECAAFCSRHDHVGDVGTIIFDILLSYVGLNILNLYWPQPLRRYWLFWTRTAEMTPIDQSTPVLFILVSTTKYTFHEFHCCFLDGETTKFLNSLQSNCDPDSSTISFGISFREKNMLSPFNQCGCCTNLQLIDFDENG